MATKSWSVKFVIPGEPLTKSNKYIWVKGKMRIPSKVQKYERKISEVAKKAMNKAKKRVTKQLVKVRAKFFLGTERRKDIQNLDKSLCDALNGIVYKDDCQIVDLHMTKHLDRDNPRAEITVTAIHNYKHFPKPDYKKIAEDRKKRKAAKKKTEKKKRKTRKRRKKKTTKKRKT